jgi:hypothetical protein
VAVGTALLLLVVAAVPVTAPRDDETVLAALRVEAAGAAPELREAPAVVPRVLVMAELREFPAIWRTSDERPAETADARLLPALRPFTATGDRTDEIPDERAYLLL